MKNATETLVNLRKWGFWMFIFPDRGTGNVPKIFKICFYTGKLPTTQEKI